MKRKLEIIRFVLTLSLLGLLQPLSAQSSINTIKAQEVVGEVVIIEELSQEASILGEGDTFSRGSIVATGSSGSVTLYFSNGSSVSLGPDTRLAIQSFTQEPFNSDFSYGDLRSEPSISDTVLFIYFGSITVRTKTLQEGSKFNVLSPSGTANLQSATAQITHLVTEGENVTIVANLYGNVEARNNDSGASWVNVDEGSLIEITSVTEQEQGIESPESPSKQTTAEISEPRPIEESDIVPNVDLSIIQIGTNASPSD